MPSEEPKKTTKDPSRVKSGQKSRRKGSNYENHVGKLFRKWAKPVFEVTGENPKDWFKRTPRSGGWSKKHAPGDVIVPKWFPFDVEAKNRQQWSWPVLFRGGAKSEQVLRFLVDAEEKAGGRPVLLIFTKNQEKDWVLLRAQHVGYQKPCDLDFTYTHHYLCFLTPDEPKVRGSFILMELEDFLKAWKMKKGLGKEI